MDMYIFSFKNLLSFVPHPFHAVNLQLVLPIGKLSPPMNFGSAGLKSNKYAERRAIRGHELALEEGNLGEIKELLPAVALWVLTDSAAALFECTRRHDRHTLIFQWSDCPACLPLTGKKGWMARSSHHR